MNTNDREIGILQEAVKNMKSDIQGLIQTQKAQQTTIDKFAGGLSLFKWGVGVIGFGAIAQILTIIKMTIGG